MGVQTPMFKINRKINKLLHPSGIADIAATVFSTVLVIILMNILSYYYLQSQPISNKLDGGMIHTINEWHGIASLSEPVTTLVLGDSVSLFNLSSGPIADRLGGSVIKLGSNSGTSFLMDAWMLEAYIQLFGPPENVVLVRSTAAYSMSHDLEYMSLVPLSWDYWNRYGVSPDWQNGELIELFIRKYLVLYSDADILQDRLLYPWLLFDYSYEPITPSQEYFAGVDWRWEQVTMNVETNEPTQYFSAFKTSKDTDNALQYISDLARSEHFQLFFLLQPEWDEAYYSGLRNEQLQDQIGYLNGFTDPDYVHIASVCPLVFGMDQLQNPQHLRPEADRIYTETYVSAIVNIQNKLTSYKAQPLRLGTVVMNKDVYIAGEAPAITIEVINEGDSDITGCISFLIRPSGCSDGEWMARASASVFSIPAGENIKVNLEINVGELDKLGSYDLIVFLRQDVDNLSNEIRIEFLNKIIVK